MLATGPWEPSMQQALVGKGDPRTYHALALNLLEGRGYVRSDSKQLAEGKLSWSYPGEPECLWPPGYPAFLCIIYRVFGVQIAYAIFAQIVLATIGAWFLMQAVALIWDRRASFWAGMLYALEPVSIQLSNTIWSEALYIPLMAVTLYWLALILRADNPAVRISGLIGLGISLGLAGWVRVTAFPLFLLLLPVLAWLLRREHGWQAGAKGASLVALAFMITVAPWYLRNYSLYGAFAFSTSSAYNLLMGIGYRGDREDLLRKAYQAAVEAGESPESLNPFQRAKYWRHVALKEWRADPVANLNLYVKRIAVVMTATGISGWGELFRVSIARSETHDKSLFQAFKEFWQKSSNLVGLIGIYTIIYTFSFYIAAFVCVLVRIRNKSLEFYTALNLFISFISIITLVNNTHPRGRTTALLFLTPLVAFCLSRGFCVFERSRAGHRHENMP